ncbi:hypothetical protein EVAR_41610_1 [Eumeta japonica]|uniref:Uncharacterized protein n=1 Tax=Eumeta variegata TaxID=151549 RepID=A0A4C1X1N0_EUMVA|nr:hypothetical protein EVAR_41610_1 [Eumeta japonica]
MELEGGHRNSVIKRRNPIEFGLVRFVLTSTLILYGNQGLMMELEDGHRNSRLMMELEGGHRNSVIKRRNPIEFGRVFNDAKESSCRRAADGPLTGRVFKTLVVMDFGEQAYFALFPLVPREKKI